MFTELTFFLSHLVTQIPLPLFVGVGSFLEEIVAPIPALVVTIAAGSLSASRDQGVLFLIFLSLIGSFGKTLASYVVFILSDAAEDIVMNRFGKLLGISHAEVEKIGKKLSQGYRDDVVLLIIRIIPFAPTATVSFICGVLKMDKRTFLWTTYVGYAIRTFLLLLIGYFGADLLSDPTLVSLFGLSTKIVVFGSILAALIWIGLRHYKKKKIIVEEN